LTGIDAAAAGSISAAALDTILAPIVPPQANVLQARVSV
jgi:hypothetical protein